MLSIYVLSSLNLWGYHITVSFIESWFTHVFMLGGGCCCFFYCQLLSKISVLINVNILLYKQDVIFDAKSASEVFCPLVPSLLRPSESAQPLAEDCPWLLDRDTASSQFSSRQLTQQIADNKPPFTFSIILSSISIDNQLSEGTKRAKQWNGYSRGLVISSFGPAVQSVCL